MNSRYFRYLLDTAPAPGGGGTGTTTTTTPPAAKPSLSPGDINLSDPAFERLGLPASLRNTPLANGPAAKKEEGRAESGEGKGAEAGGQGSESKTAEEEAAAALAERATAAGKTVEELAAEETAEAERLQARATELGKTVEEVAALEEQEAAAGQPPELAPEAEAYVLSLVEEKDAEIQEFRTKAETAEAEAARLAAELQNTKRAPMAIMGVDPIFLATTVQEIEQHDSRLAQFEAWAMRNWDGSPEVPAAGDQPAVPAFTAQQIRERYQQVKEQRAKMVPQAKQLLQTRTAEVENTKAVYPALFDSKRPESNVVKSMLTNFPELQVAIPNFHLVAGDAILGETFRKILATPEHKMHAAATAFLNTVPELKAMIVIPQKKAVGGQRPAVSKGKLPALKGRQPTGAPGKVPRAGGAGAAPRTTTTTGKGMEVSAKNLNAMKAKGLSERDSLIAMIGGAKIPTAAK